MCGHELHVVVSEAPPSIPAVHVCRYNCVLCAVESEASAFKCVVHACKCSHFLHAMVFEAPTSQIAVRARPCRCILTMDALRAMVFGASPSKCEVQCCRCSHVLHDVDNSYEALSMDRKLKIPSYMLWSTISRCALHLQGCHVLQDVDNSYKALTMDVTIVACMPWYLKHHFQLCCACLQVQPRPA